MLRAARRREIDVIVVWRLDRWGRSLVDLIATLQELTELKVGFVSLSEALDLTTPSGRAFAGMLAVFAEFERDILRDRVKAGIAQARKDGRPHGRPAKIVGKSQEIRDLARQGLSKSAIANSSMSDAPRSGVSLPMLEAARPHQGSRQSGTSSRRCKVILAAKTWSSGKGPAAKSCKHFLASSLATG